jgi:hypothetical protein
MRHNLPWLRNAPESVQRLYGKMGAGMGEVSPSRLNEQGNPWLTIFPPNLPVPGHEDVYSAPPTIPVIQGYEKVQEIIDRQLMIRFWAMMLEFKKILVCGTYFVKNPNQHESPITAKPIDRVISDLDLIPDLVTTVFSITMADKEVGVLSRWGTAVDPNIHSTITYRWSIDGRFLDEYGNFVGVQPGSTMDPTSFAIPIPIPAGSTITLTAENTGGVAGVLAARVMGYRWPTGEPGGLTDNGTFGALHTR